MSNSSVETRSATHARIRDQVIADSMDLPERIELYRKDTSRFERDEALSTARIRSWGQSLGFEDIESMDHRIASLGVSRDDLPLLLGRLTPDSGASVPSWWQVCEYVLDEPLPVDDDTLNGFLSTEDERPLPFEDAIAPWVRVSTRMLREKLPDLVDDLDPDILRKEQRGLLENIASIVRLILVGDFEAFKMQSYDANDLFLGMTVSKPPNDSYMKFTARILEDGWRGHMTRFPALARLLGTRCELWVASFGEFLERFDADRDEIQKVFSPESPLGRLVGAARGISDSHNGGRAVVICTFENGCKVVYKPRQMSVDAAWGRMVDWFNERFSDIDPVVKLEVIDQGNYGWMAFAEHRPCADLEEVDGYFTRMGIFLCLVHLLHGNDFHLENIIASGPNPIAIDLETITVPRFDPPMAEGSVGSSPAIEIFGRSVLRTLLLPMAMAPGKAEARNLGAVGLSVDAGAGGTLHRVLHAINTDFMHWRTVSLEEATKLGATNMDDAMRSKVELADGSSVVPQDHRDKLMEGYRSTYKALLPVRDEIVDEQGPLSFFDGAHVRFLNRATNVYYRLVFETCVDKAVGSGVDRWIAADRLAIGYTDEPGADLEMTNYLLECEHAAIRRGDVPYFLARANATRLATLDVADCQIVENEAESLTRSAMECARQQFEGMSETDLERQLKFIDSSYVSTIISLRRAMHGSSFGDDDAPTSPERDLSDEELAPFAQSILDHLLEGAFHGESGQLDWLDVSVDPTRDTSTVSPMDAGIYAGRGGVAILLELAYNRFGDRKYLDAAANTLAIEAGALERDATVFVAPSGMLSTAGMMLAGWRLGAHEEHGFWRDHVRKLILQVGPHAIERDTAFDIIAGSAGQILVLAYLLDEEDMPGGKDLVDALAAYIVRHASDQYGGPSWPPKNSSTKLALAGFSHGIGGIALALLHAWRITSKDEYREMALRAIACEHGLRSEEHKNWPDFRSGDLEKPNWAMHAWCHGAPGIALGRAAFLEIEDDPIARDDLEFALAAMHSNSVGTIGMSRPHLCCGSGGIGEIQCCIGTRLGRQEEYEAGVATIKRMVQVQMDTDVEAGCMGLGLLQGVAGLAWAALLAEGKVAKQLSLLTLGT